MLKSTDISTRTSRLSVIEDPLYTRNLDDFPNFDSNKIEVLPLPDESNSIILPQLYENAECDKRTSELEPCTPQRKLLDRPSPKQNQ